MQRVKKIIALFTIIVFIVVQAPSVNAEDVTATSSAQISSLPTEAAQPSPPLITQSASNSASGNQGNVDLQTGNVTVSGTVISSLNTNVAGVRVSEFTVTDGRSGDLQLDFGAHCVLGCDSSSSAKLHASNSATISSDLSLIANTGDNAVLDNTCTDMNITTGDAFVSANILTFANNNVSGGVTYGVVNIYGTFTGDILLRDVDISGNPADTLHDKNSSESAHTTFQHNTASITNNLLLSATTGNNSAYNNSDAGTVGIQSGDTAVDVNILNIANSNLNTGTWWLVFINNSGYWAGKILGVPDSYATYAGSPGTDFTPVSKEEVFISNRTAVTQPEHASDSARAGITGQTNKSAVSNNLTATANTGGNEVHNNTGGAVNIKTGNAAIIVNLLNFINNNVFVDGWLVMTVINVFGTWIGDFVTPGYYKTEEPLQQQQASSDTENTVAQNLEESLFFQKTQNIQQTSGSDSLIIRLSDISDTQSFPSIPGVLGRDDMSWVFQVDSTIGSSQVAGIRTTLPKQTKVLTKKLGHSQENRAIPLNLAWLLALLPMYGASIMIRKQMSM